MKKGKRMLKLGLLLLGLENERELVEDIYLKSIVEAFSNIETKEYLEEKIRDVLVRYLETQETPLKTLRDDGMVILDWERWEHISDNERARVDLYIFMSGFEFVLECKTLKYADKKYLEEGIKRFIELKYAEKDDFAGMLGFIIAGKPEKIVQNLKQKVKAFHPAEGIEKYLDKTCANHALSFQSKHLRDNGTAIHLFHLFFDLRATA